MSTVVVTGAAGALGRRVVAALAGHGGVGRVVAVDVAEPPAAPAPVTRWHQLDLAQPPAPPDLFAAAAGEADAIIHLAWSVGDGTGPSPGGANLRALRRVLDAAGGVGCLVHLSSATVYGAWPDNPVPLTEDGPIRPNPEFAYAVEKGEAERVVAEWAAEHPEVAVSVLRPCAVVGSTAPRLYQALAGTRGPGPDDNARPVQFLHVDDLASAVMLAWERRLAGTFNVAPDNGTPEANARAIAGGIGRLTLPGPLARHAGRWGWRLLRAGSPKGAEAYARYPWVVAADRLMAAGWSPRFTSEEALVAADERSHWDDLPPGRRQELTVLVAAGAVLGAAAGVAGGLVAWRRARARRLGAGR